MQTVIYYLKEMLDDDFDSRTKYIQEFCEQALGAEKQQIIDAFDAYTSKRRENITEGIYYYTSTFETNK